MVVESSGESSPLGAASQILACAGFFSTMTYAVFFPVLGQNTKSSKTLKCRSSPLKHEADRGAGKIYLEQTGSLLHQRW
jgi:hypothetical protein